MSSPAFEDLCTKEFASKNFLRIKETQKVATATDISLKKARLFINFLKKAGIDVAKAYLFGSVVNDKADIDSDIDLAVVSRDFQRLLYYDMKKISKHRRKVDLRLEIHPFSLEEVEKEPSTARSKTGCSRPFTAGHA